MIYAEDRNSPADSGWRNTVLSMANFIIDKQQMKYPLEELFYEEKSVGQSTSPSSLTTKQETFFQQSLISSPGQNKFPSSLTAKQEFINWNLSMTSFAVSSKLKKTETNIALFIVKSRQPIIAVHESRLHVMRRRRLYVTRLHAVVEASLPSRELIFLCQGLPLAKFKQFLLFETEWVEEAEDIIFELDIESCSANLLIAAQKPMKNPKPLVIECTVRGRSLAVRMNVPTRWWDALKGLYQCAGFIRTGARCQNVRYSPDALAEWRCHYHQIMYTAAKIRSVESLDLVKMDPRYDVDQFAMIEGGQPLLNMKSKGIN